MRPVKELHAPGMISHAPYMTVGITWKMLEHPAYLNVTLPVRLELLPVLNQLYPAMYKRSYRA